MSSPEGFNASARKTAAQTAEIYLQQSDGSLKRLDEKLIPQDLPEEQQRLLRAALQSQQTLETPTILDGDELLPLSLRPDGMRLILQLPGDTDRAVTLAGIADRLSRGAVPPPEIPRHEDYELLLGTSLAIIADLTLDHVLQEMLDGATRVLEAERGSLMLFNDLGELVIRVARGMPADVIPKVRVKIGEGISGEVARTGEPILIRDIESDERFGRKSGKAFNTKSLLSVPLKYHDEIIGVFNINNKTDGRAFDDRDLRLLLALGHQAAIAISHARQFEELETKQQELSIAYDEINAMMEEQYALYDIIRTIGTSFDQPEETLSKMVDVAWKAVQSQTAILIRFVDNRYKFIFFAGLKSDDYSPGKLDEKNHLIARMMDQEESLILNGDFRDPVPSRDMFPQEMYARDDFLNDLNGLVEGGLRSVVLIPLRDKENKKSQGVLVFANRLDGEFFEEKQRNLLDIFAKQIASMIYQHELLKEFIAKKAMQKELDVAKSIQVKLLPKKLPQLSGVDIAAFNEPAKHVSGDYYDFLDHGGYYKKVGLVIADVAGKGIPAALIMSMTRAILRTQAGEGISPATILYNSNRFLNEDIESNRYVTMFYALLDTETYDLTYAKAGHNPPIWYHAADDSIEFLELDGFPLGMFEDSEYKDLSIRLSPGDKVIFYTDGITEAMNEADEEYTLERLCQFVRDHRDYDSRALTECLRQDVKVFMEGSTPKETPPPLHDDLTLVVLSTIGFETKKVTIPSTRGAVVEFTEAFIAELEETGIEIIDPIELTMVLDEVLINAAEHGNRFSDEKSVHIEYSICKWKVELTIRDEGAGFDFEDTMQEKEKFSLYYKRGRGIQIIKQMMDKLEYSNRGRTCRIVKYLSWPGKNQEVEHG